MMETMTVIDDASVKLTGQGLEDGIIYGKQQTMVMEHDLHSLTPTIDFECLWIVNDENEALVDDAVANLGLECVGNTDYYAYANANGVETRSK